MKNTSIVLLAALLMCAARFAAAADTFSEALQKGLLEEEANHNLDAAIQAYQSVVGQYDDQRKIAATALFRLGECYRKQGKTNEASRQYQRILSDFGEQTTLVTLSRQNLSALGARSQVASQTRSDLQIQTEDEEEKEIRRLQDLVSSSPDLLNGKNETGIAPLHRASEKGQLSVARFLLEHGADVNVKDREGTTPLHLAAMRGRQAMADLLLAHKADANGKDNAGFTPLHWAASRGFLSLAELLLNSGADANPRSTGKQMPPLGEGGGYIGSTPLHYAAAGGYLAIGKVLIAHQADVQAKTLGGLSPLETAARYDRLEVVKLLLEHRADPNAKDSEGYSPLHWAVVNDNRAMVDLLLGSKADVNAKTQSGLTPLHAAAQGNKVSIAELLLTHGADAAVKDQSGVTPLATAVQSQNLELVRLLLSHGADVNSITAFASGGSFLKVPPLAYVAFVSQGKSELAELLLENKADINVRDPAERTPLHWAIQGNRPDTADTVQWLVAKGANVNAADVSGTTPLHSAVERENKEIVELLVAHGADVNAKDKNGITPLVMAQATSVIGRSPGIIPPPGIVPSENVPAFRTLPARTLGASPNNSLPASRKEIVELLRQHGAKE